MHTTRQLRQECDDEKSREAVQGDVGRSKQ
jgi:hypothetical protein